MLIINYHEIAADSSSRHRYVTPRAEFEAQIDALIDAGFSFGTLTDLLGTAAEGSVRQCAITFDDGRLGAYEHGLAILTQRGITATFFVCPDWLEKKPVARTESYSEFMTWDHAADAARRGNVIGSHGKSHRPFFDIDEPSAVAEVREGKWLIERRLGLACDHFASPWGQIDRAVTSLVRDAGYQSLAGTVQGANKFPYDRFRLRRVDASDYRSLARFESAIRGYVDAHATFEVAVVQLKGRIDRRSPRIEAVARCDLVVCLDRESYELCGDLGLPSVRHAADSIWTAESLRQSLLSSHGQMIGDRRVTFTPMTLRESRWTWTFLSSFRPGMSRQRSDIRSRTSTRR